MHYNKNKELKWVEILQIPEKLKRELVNKIAWL